ncbi:MAG: alpha-L-arabinofuranosidase [Clostridia bacterium]|nr:alpha-L-arabinofuranosidase [Clostridia bacterium]
MNHITVLFNQSKGTINPNIYGHFSEHIGGVFYDGLWVGEDSPVENIRGFRKALVEKFAAIHPPVLRWPGGCFAETYDWRDGIGPRDKRPRRVNWWYYLDKRPETNQVGTHEFVDFCRMTGAEPYFAANMTSVPPLHIRDWIEYCNMPEGTTTLADERARNGSPEPFDIRYWGIGNENHGGGGRMNAEYYARGFLRYSTVCENIPGEKTLVACGPFAHNIQWTRELMSVLRGKGVTPQAISVHYYCRTPDWPQDFTEEGWYALLHGANYMQNIIDDQRAAMDEFDPERKTMLYVDEWGSWHKDGSGPSKGYNLFEQQSSIRDAMVTALTLNIFNNRCDVVGMANVAQLCNNLHCLFLAHEENFLCTPTYHVFNMFKTHQGAKQLCVDSDCGSFDGGEAFHQAARPLDRVSVSASESADNAVTITLANTSMTDPIRISLGALGGELDGQAEITTLCSADPHACNTFGAPEAVTPATENREFHTGDALTLPAASVTCVRVKK